MLVKLYIQNFALIRNLEISPSGHLNIITGETGAGKSIMIGAVSLLIGKRADIKSLYNKDQKCIVEGIFNIGEYKLQTLFEELDLDYSEDTIIRREITPRGKSRAFINDTPVTLEVMKIVGAYLMDVHSQHDTLLLGSLNYQLSVVDTFAQNTSLYSQYIKSFNLHKQYRQQLKAMEAESIALKKESDYNQFLYDELNNAQLLPEEQVLLEEELNQLEHAEEIKSTIYESLDFLQNGEMSAIEILGVVNKKIGKLSGFSSTFKLFSNRIEEAYLELKDLTQEIEKETDKIEHNPHQASEISERLSLIYKLQQKHQVSDNKALLEIKDQLEEKVLKNVSIEKDLEEIKNKTSKAFETLISYGNELSKSRLSQIDAIRSQLESMLKNLGIPEATIAINHESIPPNESGMDEIEILFSANKGIAPLNLKQIASGGEFSRLMFCIKFIIAGKKALPTLILDEIDTGISGEIALKMARMMKEMALNHQVVVITHLPQIASSGSKHYFVFKDNSSDKAVSLIREIDKEERILEIAKMIGGDQPSSSAIDNAKELLDLTHIN